MRFESVFDAANNALQRLSCGCNRDLSRAGSLSLVRAVSHVMKLQHRKVAEAVLMTCFIPIAQEMCPASVALRSFQPCLTARSDRSSLCMKTFRKDNSRFIP